MGKTTATKKDAPAKGKATQAKKKKGGGGGDTKDVILNYMAQMHSLGISEVTEAALLKETNYAGTDSKGFRNPMKELTKGLGYITKEAKTYSLSDDGRQHLMEQGKLASPPATLEEKQAHQRELLGKMCKTPVAKLDAVWAILLDGKPHTTAELLTASGYKGADSSGYKSMMKEMKALNFLDESTGKGKVKFSDKVLKL
ncbi:expressed unknown protein [Seminavis robusta]|uniref:Uncharacterized protein n=1 Tax=Seminavis robusta TaxID=568900 RepID=A0A9N8DYY9_9STRA|nr:expressed unknown protein [Seminavis robusta]|eukprot:Sro401_g135280.1 n/a (199) ;mRNA; f:15635-16367